MWLKGLRAAITSLSFMPRRCPSAAERRAYPQREIRQLLYFSHRLIFEIRDVHVRHAARRPLQDL